MSSINKNPAGWLGFLGIKNFGRNPPQTGQLLQPVWDLQQLYLETNAVRANISATTASLGYDVWWQPPNGQNWYVHGVGFWSVALGAGEALQFSVATADPLNVQIVPLGGDSLAGVPNDIALCSCRRPFILADGASVGTFTTRWTAAAPIVTAGAIWYSTMDI